MSQIDAAAPATAASQALTVPSDQAKRIPVRRRSAAEQNDGAVGDVMQEVWDTLEKDSDGTVSRKCFIDALR